MDGEVQNLERNSKTFGRICVQNVNSNSNYVDYVTQGEGERVKSILKYPGSKWRIAQWIISHFPKHHSYLEPFFGSGAVFFNKKPSNIETINDLDLNVVNLFRCIRENPVKLSKIVEATPYSRYEYDQAYYAEVPVGTNCPSGY